MQKIKTKILFCQFSNKLLNKNIPKIIKDNLDNIYNAHYKDGYYRNEHYLEIPTWIPILCYNLPNERYNKKSLIIANISKAVKFIKETKPDIVLFSCMCETETYIKQILSKFNVNPNIKFIIGNYTSAKFDSSHLVIQQFSSVVDFCKTLEGEFEYGLDYSLFKKQQTIPRVATSLGCDNRCSFCTVTHPSDDLSRSYIYTQFDSLKYLDYKLIYIDDKDFNFDKLEFEFVSTWNIKGKYIVQACVNNINATKLERIKDIFAIEVGIESYNNEILKEMNKKQTVKDIFNATVNITSNDIKFIPNIIVGYPIETKETYHNTLNYLNAFKESIYYINIYNFSLYKGTKDYKRYTFKEGDDLENNFNKSFYTPEQIKLNKWFYKELVKLNKKILGYG